MDANQIKSNLAWIVGCEKEVLESCSNPEKNRKMTSGLVMIASIIFAGISVGLTGFVIFKSIPVSIFISILWMFLIWSLDRNIIISLDKTSKSGFILNLITRLLIVISLSFLNSIMMKTFLFKTEIKANIERNIKAEQSELENEIKLKYASADSTLEVKKKVLIEAQNDHLNVMGNTSQEIMNLDQEILELRKQLIGEIQGRVGSGKEGDGPAAEALRVQIASLEAQKLQMEQGRDLANSTNVTAVALNQAREAYAKAEKERDEQYTQIAKDYENGKQDIVDYNTDGFLDRYESLIEVSKRTPILSMFIFLIFFIFEAAPVLMKVIQGKGEYEKAIQIVYEKRDSEQEASRNTIVEQTLKQTEAQISHNERYLELTENLRDKVIQSSTRKKELLLAEATSIEELAHAENQRSEAIKKHVNNSVDNAETILVGIDKIGRKTFGSSAVGQLAHRYIQKIIGEVGMFFGKF